MTSEVPVVDLFSGPGGLAEGFAALRNSSGQPRFRVALSIEMDPVAHRTLRLRAFLRRFSRQFPTEYYKFLNGEVSEEPDWATLYPKEWEAASDETRQLKLGTSAATDFVQQRLREIRENHGDRTVLLGGPPCQSYSVAGRSRNAGNAKYDPDTDERQSLYREYVCVLEQLQPAVAVMENVKGMLSARHQDEKIFPRVMDSLCDAGGENRYHLYALASSREQCRWRHGLQDRDFLVRAEKFGIPQSRHRVFVLCIREDIAEELPKRILPQLKRSDETVSVKDVIGAMPELRSRLSRNDHDASWQKTIENACEFLSAWVPEIEQDQKESFSEAITLACESVQGPALPCIDATGSIDLGDSCPIELREWIVDGNLNRLPNNDTRGHMAMDLWRYLFAASFACAAGRSPRAKDFPPGLAPNHQSWNTGKFHDRFRVQLSDLPSTTITSHISKDGHYFIHPDPTQCRSLTVREAARLQTFPDNYYFHGGRTQQYVQVGNAVPPYLAWQIATQIWEVLGHYDSARTKTSEQASNAASRTQQVPAQVSTSIQSSTAS